MYKKDTVFLLRGQCVFRILTTEVTQLDPELGRGRLGLVTYNKHEIKGLENSFAVVSVHLLRMSWWVAVESLLGAAIHHT